MVGLVLGVLDGELLGKIDVDGLVLGTIDGKLLGEVVGDADGLVLGVIDGELLGEVVGEAVAHSFLHCSGQKNSTFLSLFSLSFFLHFFLLVA